MCKRCPFNVSWEKACPKCADNTRKLVAKVLDGQKPPAEFAGRACRGARDELQIALMQTEGVFIEEPPGPCWRKGGPAT